MLSWSGFAARTAPRRWRSRSSSGLGLLRAGERAPKIGFRLVRELATQGFPVVVACRVLEVSTSGYYEWRNRPPSARDLEDAYLLDQIIEVHAAARADLRRSAGACRTRLGTLSRGGPSQGRPVDALPRPGRCPSTWLAPAPALGGGLARSREPRVRRRYPRSALGHRHHPAPHLARGGSTAPRSSTSSPDGWWAGRSRITCAPNSWSTRSRWPDCAASRSGRSCTRTAAPSTRPGCSAHRLREAGLMGSMGKVACAYDNALMESFWGSMQIELLDRRTWDDRAELAGPHGREEARQDPRGSGWRAHGAEHGQRPLAATGTPRSVTTTCTRWSMTTRGWPTPRSCLRKGTTCAGFLRRAANYFAEHGITPIERIMTDNAWAYRCTSHTERQRLGHLNQPGRAPSTTLRVGCNTFQSDR